MSTQNGKIEGKLLDSFHFESVIYCEKNLLLIKYKRENRSVKRSYE